ncbi:hypothetical protein Scep_027489 [Stephania cephalantha]|uniref:Uncharacterized protein n=1 Tax=Stephania cephalantha TaxID=152367 RepID=A0AAP0HKU5_9MAGN
MARVVLISFVALICVLPALVSASRPVRNPFVVHGKVVCDTCCAGFETTATTPVKDAIVRLECKNRDTLEEVYSDVRKTDRDGAYEFTVMEDHEDQLCQTQLVSSGQKDCSKILAGRERANVIVTNNNGIISSDRFANNLVFVRNQPMSGCAQVLQQYKLDDEDA